MTPQDLQLDWLKCFVAVVDAGSLSSAAGEVHRSQSAVSMQLKKLEGALGSRLLERDARKLELTPEGQMLLGYARRILDLHAEAQAALSGEELTGRVRLGVPDDYAAKYLTPVLKRFAPRHGGVEIELDCEQSTSLIPRVASGDLDLALVSRDHSRRGILLFHEPMVWVGAVQFELWRRDPLPIAVYEDTSLARRSAIHSLAQQGRRYKVVYNSSSLAGQIAAVESGLAVAALTQCSAPGHLQILGSEHGLGPLEPMEVAVYRSRASRGSKAVDSLQNLLVRTLRLSGPV
ncbi:LysR family transcriptional regulator [Ralstonia nicotianae]|uniref:LysR family transcriptional regulator n=4 Tax=Ralstonia solanacearum species complex TaxID=3116862 RepID=A0A0S4V9I0_RALSL|nr:MULTISPECIES: LysR substrate-binding domain-containing protein [Ralstonia solanacearum species complex]ANH34174.1 LysR family transcriptional regulator [Ralstonia solanacearum]APC67707.1 LysR family transcriptional regulator [Ralstonia solanacearum OE1-1]ARS55203.1 LysR family transcriptional regulator [Ralstonia solanacearum FJAT-91]ESS51668.1 transcription regulator protein [Ralstonia solanacearum SD54]AGH83151.1 Transcriptional regulator, LysR family [Ralstonia pseudosolanacearum FQY_4]